MEPTNLLQVCGVAFVAVMVLLTGLAGIIELITLIFPHRKDGPDDATLSAITQAVTSAYPGARVTNVKELKKGS